MDAQATTQTQQPKQPKDILHEIMVEMFGMIEDMEVNEGLYLQFADLFKQMNLNINRLAEMKQQIATNYYYIHYVRPQTRITTLRRKRLTEAQKAKHKDYTLCNCGRYIHIDEQENHLRTQVHYQGRRNRKYALTKPSEEQMELEINREVLLQEFIIKHLIKTKNINPDNVEHDEA